MIYGQALEGRYLCCRKNSITVTDWSDATAPTMAVTDEHDVLVQVFLMTKKGMKAHVPFVNDVMKVGNREMTAQIQ